MEVQLDFTPEIEKCYMLFKRCLIRNVERDLSKPIKNKYFNFRSKIQLDRPVHAEKSGDMTTQTTNLQIYQLHRLMFKEKWNKGYSPHLARTQWTAAYYGERAKYHVRSSLSLANQTVGTFFAGLVSSAARD